MTTNDSADQFWQRQRDRLEAVRELYRERGILVLSPSVLSMWLHKKKLLTEVEQMRLQTDEAYDKLIEQDKRYRQEQFCDTCCALIESSQHHEKCEIPEA